MRIYLSMVNDDLLSKNHISKKTYSKIEFNILRFGASCYVNLNNSEKYTFTYENRKEIITNKCGLKGYLLFEFFVLGFRVRKMIKKSENE